MHVVKANALNQLRRFGVSYIGFDELSHLCAFGGARQSQEVELTGNHPADYAPDVGKSFSGSVVSAC